MEIEYRLDGPRHVQTRVALLTPRKSVACCACGGQGLSEARLPLVFEHLFQSSFGSANDLANALQRATVAHGEPEKRTGRTREENWPAWYAEYMVAEQSGTKLPV